jgi:hypothetical protein
MTKKQDKPSELKNQIRLTSRNVQILGKARKTCTCSGQKPHYHALLHYDSESGDEYLETSETKHVKFIAKLNRQLAQLENRAQKAKAPRP